jgi:hypothetical protein
MKITISRTNYRSGLFYVNSFRIAIRSSPDIATDDAASLLFIRLDTSMHFPRGVFSTKPQGKVPAPAHHSTPLPTPTTRPGTSLSVLDSGIGNLFPS